MDLEQLEKKSAELEKRIKAAEDNLKEREKALANAIAGGSHSTPSNMGNSDERQALSYFGCHSVKQLLSVNTGDPMYKHVPSHLKFLVKDLKKSIDVSRMMQQVLNGEQLDRGPVGGENVSVAHVKGVLDGNYYGKHVLTPKLKAFGTDVAAAGLEWVPTIISSQWIEEFELERRVLDQFKQINMPSSPFKVPVQTDLTIARRQTESCDPADNIPAANFGTSQIILEAEKLVEFMCLPEELNEDSAPQILGMVRDQIGEAQFRAHETAILNGDDTSPHMDTDVTGLVDARTAWKGLRRLALDNSANGSFIDFGATAVDLTKLRSMRTAMGKFGVGESQLVWIVSPRVYAQFLSIPEVTTVDKFGPQATILRGSLAALDGIPIVTSEFARDDLAASGVNTAPGDTQSACFLVNRSRFMWGVRRPMRMRVLTDPTPPSDRWLAASWWRGDFQGHAQSANEVSVVVGRNIS